jgi:hypothetical protein
MTMRAALKLLLASAAIAAAAPAGAQLYKWVDERGVTNYSSQPPADPGSARQLKEVEDRVSVYTPDAALLRDIEAFRRSAAEESRRPAQRAEPPAPPRPVRAAHDPCANGYNSDCNVPAIGYYPVYVKRHRPLAPYLPQSRLTPGVTAGNVVGMNGYTPGLSAYAPALDLPAQLPWHPGPKKK